MAVTVRPVRDPKGERIALRVSRAEREVIAQACVVANTSVSEFVLRATLARAEELLAERREFTLEPAQWSAFVALLDEDPAQNQVDRPKLRRLLTEASVLEG